MDGQPTSRERELYGVLSIYMPGTEMTVEGGPTGRLRFQYKDVIVYLDRTQVASAAEDIDDLYKEVELQLRRRSGAGSP